MKSRRNLGLFLVLLLLLTIIPLTVWAVKNLRFETRKKASEPVPVEEKEFSEIRPLNISQPIYEFNVTGKLTLKKENSFFRIILIDKDQKEYLVYEAYPLIAEQSSFSFTNACEETCALEAITPDKLRIEGLATDFEITQTFYEDKFQKLPAKIQSLGIERAQAELKKEKESLKIQKLNEQIKAKGMKWIAGETSISKLSYEEKKKLFSKPDGTPVEELPNLQGFEYYKGGIFEIKDENEKQVLGDASPSLPSSWDWRNVHGENWLTSVKDQGGAGTCWAFTTTSSYESQINLYFNQHLDVDLSEQMLVDCSDRGPIPELSGYGRCYPESRSFPECFPYYCRFRNYGIADEECDPYAQRGQLYPSLCDYEHICLNWEQRMWKASSSYHYSWDPYDFYPLCREQVRLLSKDEFKKELIEKGPMDSAIAQWQHGMVLVGFEDNSDWETIEACNIEEFCTSQGCISRTEPCTPGDHTCGGTSLENFTCNGSGEWVPDGRYCSGSEDCLNDQCSQTTEFQEGDIRCTLIGGLRGWILPIRQRYKPGEGDSYWIWKNSWGIDWGENGYGRLAVSTQEMHHANLAIGPFAPPLSRLFWPAGFDGTIKCVDKDNDKYCNWGISENKPDTCPAFCQSEKDCDDSNPNLGPFDENLNCTPLNISPTPSPESCLNGNLGNLNCDYEGKINNEDLNILLNNWSPFGPVPTPNPGQRRADLNEDEKVNETDLTIPLFNWNP